MRIIHYTLLLTALSFIGSASAEDTQRKIQVSLSLSPELSQLSAKPWKLYLFARAPDGRIPLASKTLHLNQLPLQVSLTEKDFLLPEITLKDAAQVVIIAKASPHGDAHKTIAGDITGHSVIVSFDSQGTIEAEVQIDRRVE